eukprot:m.354929 g.354929  ORF g.354929 m.354929 type:complete len:160 (-) comp16597_c1_seq1:237-716(-)
MPTFFLSRIRTGNSLASMAAVAEKKDKVVFVDKEEEATAEAGYASDDSSGEEDERMGAVGPDGEIDWDCPCLHGMTKGPCGAPFKEAFACFVASKAEPKGEDCLMEMKAMHDCIMAHPEHFESSDEESDENTTDSEDNEETASDQKSSNDTSNGKKLSS